MTVTERDMLDALARRYTAIRRGTNADRWVRAEHVRLPVGYGMASRIADFMALDTYGPSVLHGIEVKVSRSDWLAELRAPEKSAVFARHCDHWWLAVPSVDIVRDDLPATWGLLAPGPDGRLRAVRTAPPLDREPMTPALTAQWARAIQQTATRSAR